MAVDLKKWRQRNAAERVKAALTRPKKDNTGERLRRQFSTAADKAIKALDVKGSNRWLKYGYNDDVVVTAKLGPKIIRVTGDEAIALPPSEAKAYLKDVIDATNAGQLDRELLAAAGGAPAPKRRELKLKRVAVVGEVKPQPVALVGAAPASMARARVEAGLTAER
ncbi:MAG: hypothetical protein H0X53_03285 [Sphingomonas sp.]|nr:hypothetical protein [Sphingomonas sp.]